MVRDPAGELLGEAGFALLYFQRATDLIPDSIPGMGLLDDAMIVHIVLGCHEPAFKFIPDGDKLSWPAPSFRHRSTALSCLPPASDLVLPVDAGFVHFVDQRHPRQGTGARFVGIHAER